MSSKAGICSRVYYVLYELARKLLALGRAVAGARTACLSRFSIDCLIARGSKGEGSTLAAHMYSLVH